MIAIKSENLVKSLTTARLRIGVRAACVSLATLTMVTVASVQAAHAGAMRRDLTYTPQQTLPGNDDGSTGRVDLGFTANFFGLNFNQLYVNNNGNITFDRALSTFTPFGLTSTASQIIAPFFGDVDTRSGNPVTYGSTTVDGRQAFAVNWDNVGYFSYGTNRTNSFQLVMVDRSDTGAGNFDFEFNFDRVQWEAGSASGGVNGLGGSPARVGFSNGTGAPGSFFELAGSAVNGAFLDSNLTTGLIYNRLNSDVNGRYVFSARNGSIQTEVPEPSSIIALFTLGALGVNAIRKGRKESTVSN
ncbi:nidogen-like domain-containing protein [Floridanema aerugineum]|uniref:Nidogen-like domain-containing protein n=1 Tax=Floridaenema aerugineum BLCC-F46 TaxID=3153654 RepID=A0ABV4X199_9CYAN